MDCVLVNNWCCSSHGRSTIDYFDSCGFDSFVYWWWVVGLPAANCAFVSISGNFEKTSSLIDFVKQISNRLIKSPGSCMARLEELTRLSY
jgi:hypothetical protein